MRDVELQTGAKCIGFVMDNTAANRSAEAALERAHPYLVNIGCWSHALSLLIKDFAKRFKWVELAYMRAVEVSNAINNSEDAVLAACGHALLPKQACFLPVQPL
jgi:hypothetical protein